MRKQGFLSRFLLKETRKGFSFVLLFGFLLPVFSLLAAAALLFLYYAHFHPDFSPLRERHFNAHSIVYSKEDEVVSEFLTDNRIPIPYEVIPKPLIQAFVAAEDAYFFQHDGIDYRGIARALWKNLLAGSIVQGGSTITQQVIRTLFLSPRRSLLRKLKEAAFAFALEKDLTKEQILFLYLNNIYLGSGAYGIEAASKSYFNKPVGRLNLAEMAMLAGLVKGPSRYSPPNNFGKAKERQAYVLNRMVDLGFISEEERGRALQQILTIRSRRNVFFSKAPYFSELVRQQVEKRYGKERVSRGGLRIYTTLDLSLQKAAQESVEGGLRELDKRQGFRGPIRSLSAKEMRSLLGRKKGPLAPLPSGQTLEGVILSKDDLKGLYRVWVENRSGVIPYSEMTWALRVKPEPNLNPRKVKNPSDILKPGDVVHVRVKDSSPDDQLPVFSLDQKPLVQGALLCIDPRNGYVKAMVGGRDFGESQFNRAVHSRRQPGSAFKPLIYAAALEKGYTPSTILMDSPVTYAGSDDDSYWAPKNYDKSFNGPVFLQDALASSRNVVTVKILEDIGIAYALRFIKKCGIESPIKRNLSIALGTSEVSMLQLTSAFCAFANGGARIRPTLIRKIARERILGKNGSCGEAEEEGGDEDHFRVQKEQILSPENAFLMTDLLQGVVQHGTGRGAKVLGRPVAGKTGTSSDYADAWFIGYTPSLVASVWVGFDDKTSLGENETGARAALPIWISFMRRALKKTPIEDFKVPEAITLRSLNVESDLGTGRVYSESLPMPMALGQENKRLDFPKSINPTETDD